MEYDKVLTEYGVSFEPGDKKLIVKCPFHNDTTPSGAVFLDTGNFSCFSCDKAVKFQIFLAYTLNRGIGDVYHELGKKYSTSRDKIIPPTTIERYHGEIWKNDKLRSELHKRGITDDIIRRRRLGAYSTKSISIPIRNEAGEFVNVRIYSPNSDKAKYVNLPKYGKPTRLYPIDQLAYDVIVIAGGELKALAAAAELNEHGIGAIAGTAGELNSWTTETLRNFQDCSVYVIMDVDETGEKAAKKICRGLRGVASCIFKVDLPLDKTKFPKGDINDFVAGGNKLLPLIENAEEWVSEHNEKYKDNGKADDISLNKAVHADNTERRMAFKAVVSGLDTSPYAIPKDVEIKCTRDEKFCSICEVMALDPENQIVAVQRESKAILKLVGRPEKEHRTALMDEFMIPPLCKSVSFEAKSHHNVEFAQLSEELKISNRDEERTMQSSYCIGDGLNANETYNMVGRMFPDPQTQQSTLIVSKYDAARDSLSLYECKLPERLRIFQPKEWTREGIQEKLDEVYDDLEANVTRIFRRRNIHLVTDLVYHSPLLIPFKGKTQKGWIEALIIGDSAQGKTETTQNLMYHYGLGERVDCKGATAAGLLGGLQNFGKKWFVVWGKIPTNDRRLVILEEIKGTSVDVISKLTDMRSSGRAELTKIVKRSTQARTRQLWISNPRRQIPLAGHSYGITAVKELIGALEDVRRFDCVLVVDKDEIDTTGLHRLDPKIEHVYTSDLCRELILWGWTREKIVFENENHLIDEAEALCKEFVEDIPIIDKGSTHLKLARLASALAIRTFSTDDFETVIVRPVHVEYIVSFLREEYEKETTGYKRYSNLVSETNKMSRPEEVKRLIIKEVPYPKAFVEHIMQEDEIDVQYLQDILAWDVTMARGLLSGFVLRRALRKDGKIYRKTPEFIRLLKEIQVSDRPDHIGDASVTQKY